MVSMHYLLVFQAKKAILGVLDLQNLFNRVFVAPFRPFPPNMAVVRLDRKFSSDSASIAPGPVHC